MRDFMRLRPLSFAVVSRLLVIDRIGCRGMFVLAALLALCASGAQIEHQLALLTHDAKHLAGGQGEGEQSGDRHNWCEFAPLWRKDHQSVADCGVGVGAEINGITQAGDQAKLVQHHAPDKRFEDVQRQHEQDGAGENVGSHVGVPLFCTQLFGLAPVALDNTVQSGAVNEHDDDQHHAAEEEYLQRDEVGEKGAGCHGACQHRRSVQRIKLQTSPRGSTTDDCRHHFGCTKRAPITAPASTSSAGLTLRHSIVSSTNRAMPPVVQPVTAVLAILKVPASSRPTETGARPCWIDKRQGHFSSLFQARPTARASKAVGPKKAKITTTPPMMPSAML